MSVLAFTGLPGHGKSYGVIEHIVLPALKAGRTVVTNIPLHRDQVEADFPLADVHGIDLSAYATGEALFSELPAGAVIVLDELWRIWPAGLRANKVLQDHKSFLAEHRHRVGEDGLTTEIVLVTQDLAQIASFARQLVEKTFIAHKLTAVGASNRYRVDVYHGAVTGQRGPDRAKAGSNFGTYRADVYRYYVSHTMGGGHVGVEVMPDKRGNVLRSPLILLGFPFAVVALLVGFWGVTSYLGGRGGGAAPVAAEVRDDSVQERSAVVARPAPRPAPQIRPSRRVLAFEQWQAAPDLPLSSTWRIGATIEMEDPDRGVSGYARLVSAEGREITIALAACKRLPAAVLQWECVYDGERVTSFSGRSGGFLSGITGG